MNGLYYSFHQQIKSTKKKKQRKFQGKRRIEWYIYLSIPFSFLSFLLRVLFFFFLLSLSLHQLSFMVVVDEKLEKTRHERIHWCVFLFNFWTFFHRYSTSFPIVFTLFLSLSHTHAINWSRIYNIKTSSLSDQTNKNIFINSYQYERHLSDRTELILIKLVSQRRMIKANEDDCWTLIFFLLLLLPSIVVLFSMSLSRI